MFLAAASSFISAFICGSLWLSVCLAFLTLVCTFHYWLTWYLYQIISDIYHFWLSNFQIDLPNVQAIQGKISSGTGQIWGFCAFSGERMVEKTFEFAVLTAFRISETVQRLSGISWTKQFGNGLKFGMLMYPDHPEKLFGYNHGLSTFEILAAFGLSETDQICCFRSYSGKRIERMAWNLARFCILKIFRTH